MNKSYSSYLNKIRIKGSALNSNFTLLSIFDIEAKTFFKNIGFESSLPVADDDKVYVAYNKENLPLADKKLLFYQLSGIQCTPELGDTLHEALNRENNDLSLSALNIEVSAIQSAIYDYAYFKNQSISYDDSQTMFSLYAVFDTAASEQHDFVRVIQTTWDWIYGVWMPENGWRRGPGYEFETYTEADRKYTERIFVPIVREED